jgi:3-dehydroquinate synthase/2-deoxy-scyllo-inosose synthase
MTAGLLYRGIRLVHVPTTLLAMHDSVTSLKQGVNASGAKNILGLFHTPSAVFIDLKFLESLPEAHIRAGLAELVKNGLVLGGDYLTQVADRIRRVRQSLDPPLFGQLIEMGISAKCGLMRGDPHERGRAMVMEYGHTIGHAIELCYSGALNHGDSITWGMHCAAWIANQLGYMSSAELDRHEELINLLGLLPTPADEFRIDELRARVGRDNKRGYLAAADADGVAMVLLSEPGAVINSDQPFPLTLVPRRAVDEALVMLGKRWESSHRKP